MRASATTQVGRSKQARSQPPARSQVGGRAHWHARMRSLCAAQPTVALRAPMGDGPARTHGPHACTRARARRRATCAGAAAVHPGAPRVRQGSIHNPARREHPRVLQTGAGARGGHVGKGRRARRQFARTGVPLAAAARHLRCATPAQKPKANSLQSLVKAQARARREQVRLEGAGHSPNAHLHGMRAHADRHWPCQSFAKGCASSAALLHACGRTPPAAHAHAAAAAPGQGRVGAGRGRAAPAVLPARGVRHRGRRGRVEDQLRRLLAGAWRGAPWAQGPCCCNRCFGACCRAAPPACTDVRRVRARQVATRAREMLGQTVDTFFKASVFRRFAQVCCQCAPVRVQGALRAC